MQRPPPPAITIIPTRTAIYTQAIPGAPISMPSKNALAHPVRPVTAANTTAPVTTNTPKTGTTGNTNIAAPVKGPGLNIAATTPSVPVRIKTGDNAAPTTAERTGMPSYLNTPPKKVTYTPRTPTPTTTNTAGAPVNGNANTPANALKSANTPVTGTANTAKNITPPVTTPALKKVDTTGAASQSKTVSALTAPAAKKDSLAAKKDSLIAKKDTAKKDSLLAKKDTTDDGSTVFEKRRIAFLEIGGPGLAISANYDMRVKIGKSNGFGFRAGAGYFQSGNNWVFTVPLQANYLYGKNGMYLEFGLGTTFLISRGDNYSSKNFIFDDDTGFIATGTIGVRYQPANGKLNFRLGYVPIIDVDGWVNAGGFSIGYNF